ncbi:tripartite tricarboxylate transporter TctB family protein [Brucella sp. 21LCYQ03]|nr:tripartite tricarboxylate transporter TctB family protein [Brucella sp. 21LCYQ03]
MQGTPNRTSLRSSGKPRNLWEIGTAALLFATGAIIVIESLRYPLGTLRQLGPGAVPLAIGGMLSVFSILIGIKQRRSETQQPQISRRASVCVIAAMLIWAATVNFLGLVPATALLVVISCLGVSPVNPVRTLALSIAIPAIGYLVFILGFRLPIRAFGWM